MSGKRSRARKPRARRAGRAQTAEGRPGPEAPPPPPDAGGRLDEAGAALAGHVTGSRPAPQGHPEAARPERPRAAERPVPAEVLGSELVPVPAADMEAGGPGGRTHSLGAELRRLQEVQLCLAQEQQLLADRRRQVQLQMQLWQEEQLWREEQLWLQQLQEEQAWVRLEGLELAMALEQLQSEGLEVLQTQGQVRPGGQAGGGGTDSGGAGGRGAVPRVPGTHRHPAGAGRPAGRPRDTAGPCSPSRREADARCTGHGQARAGQAGVRGGQER